MPILRAQGSYKITPKAQSNEKTCWLAVYTMMYQTNDYTEAELQSKLKAANISLETTLKDDQQETAGKAVGFVSEKSAVLTDFKTVRKYIETYGAFKASISVGDSGHALLVFAFDPDKEYIYYYNPWSDDWTSTENRNADVAKPLWCAFNTFQSMLANRKSVVGSLQRWS
jgi:hypothetical protein